MRKIPFLLLFATAACAQPFEGRVASRLAEAGLSREMADCMAKRWVDRLSLAQLQKISGLAEELGTDRSQGRLTIGRFIGRISDLNDPEIYSVVSSSSLACALGA